MKTSFSTLLLFAVVVACNGARQLLAPNGAISGAVSAKYFYGAKNLDATLLILDVNSLNFKGNHPYFYGMAGPDTDTEGKCADRCAKTTGCNAFVSCPTQAGCGRFCKAYVAANPALKSAANGLDNYVNNKLPFKAFGVWTYPTYYSDGCVNGTNGAASAVDKWNWGLCSLKTVPNVNSVKFFTSSPDSPQDGFVSGVLIQPKNCPAGLPYSICGKCNQLKAPTARAACLACAKLFKVKNAVKEATNIGDMVYDYCPRCFQAGKNPATCVNCLKTKAATGGAYSCVI